MGAVLAKFRKEKTTYEILETLELDIKKIEEYSVSTQARQKRYVGNFLVISIGLYVIGFIVFYFAFFPPTWTERITYSMPLLIFPLLIFLLKRLVAWYFQRKLNKNNSKLLKLRGEKKKVIEKVMDKETYKVALEILNRFADKANGFKAAEGNKTNYTDQHGFRLEQPNTFSMLIFDDDPKSASSFSPSAITPRVGALPATTQKVLSDKVAPLESRMLNQSNTKDRQPLSRSLFPGDQSAVMSRTPVGRMLPPSNTLVRTHHNQVPRLQTPYPIINQQDKGVLEKMVDYLIGDGPQNRFAMICKVCYAHNGMALQEEYEYAAFRCAFCAAMNPSKKLRPIAPKLPTITPTRNILTDVTRRGSESSSSTSTSEKYSGADTDEDEGFVPVQNQLQKEAPENKDLTQEVKDESNELKKESISESTELNEESKELVINKSDTEKKNV